MKEIVKIIRYSWSLKRYYLATAGFVIIIALLSQATPFLLKFAVDGIVRQITGHPVPMSYFVILVSLILATDLLITILSNIQGHIGDILGQKLNTLLSQRYYDHLLQLPTEYYDNEQTGKMSSRLERSIATISQLMNAFANNFIGFFLTSGITLVILAYYSWPVALLLAGLFPLYIWMTSLSSRAWQAKQEGINQDVDTSQGRFIETINQIRVVKSFVQEQFESRFFADKRRSVEDRTKGQSRQWHYFDVIRRLSLNVIFFLIYGFIIYQTVKGRFGLGTMTLMIQLATQAQWPLFASSFIVDNIQRAQAGSKDFFKVMETKPAVTDSENAGNLKVTKGIIEYRDVDFAYSGGQKVLNKISFAIGAGQKLALVGESGEGKTTISNLLLRFYEPSKGQILIDGQDVSKVSQESLRQNIAVVFQEPALFSGTVAENIKYGRPNATKEQMEAAGQAANAHDFISRLPKGYDTEIGERGVKLSGGQKQRVAIARAILKDAPLLILDEATSSLDSKAEREVQDALEKLMHGRTTMIIAHRLSTIQNVDQIVGIIGGQVAEQGSPEKLAKGNGIYSELLKLQTPTRANKARLKQYDLVKV